MRFLILTLSYWLLSTNTAVLSSFLLATRPSTSVLVHWHGYVLTVYSYRRPDFLVPLRHPTITGTVPKPGEAKRLKRIHAAGLIIGLEGAAVVNPCKRCKDRGYTCTVFSERIKGDICAYCKRNGKSPCNAGQSHPGNDDTAPSITAGDILHQISVHYGISGFRQLVQVMEEIRKARRTLRSLASDRRL